MMISAKDRERLRALAAHQYELSQSDAMKQLWADWEAHGAMSSSSRPMIRIETFTFKEDIVPQLMQCEGEEARRIEEKLLMNMVNHELFGDDTLVPDHYAVTMKTEFVPFGLPVKKEVRSDSVGHHFDPYLFDLEEDYHKLGESIIRVDQEGYQRELEEADALFGDLLPARHKGVCLYAVPTQDIVHIMAMEDMYMSMYDYPELFLEMMDRLADDYIAYFEAIKAGGMLLPTATDEHLNQGSYCFTPDLPKEGPVDFKDVWFFADSQETASISPAITSESPDTRQIPSDRLMTRPV